MLGRSMVVIGEREGIEVWHRYRQKWHKARKKMHRARMCFHKNNVLSVQACRKFSHPPLNLSHPVYLSKVKNAQCKGKLVCLKYIRQV